jgi:hypothetical protein
LALTGRAPLWLPVKMLPLKKSIVCLIDEPDGTGLLGLAQAHGRF